ncbi:DUF1194 domain-containing protein [Mesorhizobium sp. LHD-90]|uniref:DUF1194 domain-containing protein n=1 Tax=Mesorhizobium sp. LHD-90 TaxID=3071414 RepID=UPI0027E0858D|nr:DUF1194 domain-containing protein [Mesorhizobium sp. LHD-90]MDQ6432642.1 DUF1194 domain-containing protein [Mesorhizobium sp. LHD-90]
MLSLLGLLFCLGCEPMPVAAEMPVDVELVLAVDVSRSMDVEEFALQRAGYVEAIRHPAFVAAVRAGRRGRIAITYFEWAGTVREESLVAWHIVDGPESAVAFASVLAERPFGGYLGTSISGALDFATGLFDSDTADGTRRVIDVSGDGPNNTGLPVTAARDRAVAAGVVVNGLPILIRPSFTLPDLDRYYAECVIGGPGSFVLPIRSADEFATAIRRKLILEVSGAAPPARTLASTDEPVDCLRGERDRRFYSDPYFPELDR